MSLHAFNWLDYAIVGIIVFSTLVSLVRGFMREALSLAIWVGAFWIAYKCAGGFAERFLSSVSSSESIRHLLGFLAIFFLTLVVGAVINYFVGRLVYQTGLSGVDRVIGLGFGFARGVLLVGVLLLCGVLTNMSQNPAWAASQVLPQFQGIVTWLYGILPQKMGELAEVAQKEATKQLGLPDDALLDLKPGHLKEVSSPDSPPTSEPGVSEQTAVSEQTPVAAQQAVKNLLSDSSNKKR
ncbi:MAG: colicin production protein [Gammaproteobacteria bacterium]|jgi:membrane protein required for colicin V production|nr:colicin production protein [Gammaproteobacteria bacterium]